MSRKVRLAHTRIVLSDLDDALKKSLSTDVEEIMNFAVLFKSSMLTTQLQVSKMIETIDSDRFPDDKKLQGQILELEDSVVPSAADGFNLLRDKMQKELVTLQSAVSQCFERMSVKLKIAPGEDDSRSVITPSIVPMKPIVPPIATVKPELVVTPDLNAKPEPSNVATSQNATLLNSANSSSSVVTITPPRPTTAPPSQNPDIAEAKEEPRRPLTAAAIRKAVTASSKKNTDIDHLLEDFAKNDSSPKPDAWINEEELPEDEPRGPTPVDEDEITPWDSVSNIGSPDFPTPHTTTTVPVNPVRVNLSNLESKVVIPRHEFENGQVIPNVTCEWIDNQFYPYRFWLRVTEPEYDDLATRIEQCKSQIRLVSKEMVEKKLYCLAKYQGSWYRAYVTNVMRDSVVVLFIDYGNMERVSFNEIAHMPQEFASLKWQAFWVALWSVKPLTAIANPNQCEAWGSGVLDVMRSFFQDGDATIECRVKAALKRLPFLVMVRTQKADKFVLLHKMLVERKLVASVDTCEQIRLLSVTSPSALPTCTPITGTNTPSNNHDQKQKQTSSAPVVAREPKPAPVPTPVPIESTVIPLTDVGALQAPQTCQSGVVEAFNAFSVQNSSPVDICPPLPVGREFNIKITDFKSADDFSIQLAEGPFLQSKLYVDQDLAKKCCEKQDATVRIGRYVVYRSPKRDFYARGKIVAISKNGQSLDIVDIDTGITDSDVPFPGEIGCLPNDLKKCSRMSIRASLDRSSRGQLQSDFKNFFKLRIANCALLASVSPNAKIDKVAMYRTGCETLPLSITVVDKNRKTPLADLLFTSDFKESGEPESNNPAINDWKFATNGFGDDDDDEDELIFPSNPEMYLLGFEPKDDQLVCKHFRRSGQCPRGEYCPYKHVQLDPYRSTCEVEEFGLVDPMDAKLESRIFLRLPCDWETAIPKALEHYSNANVVPLWFQMPLGAENWKGREEELFNEMELQGDVTEFEEPYLELEINLIDSYNAKEQKEGAHNRPTMIPTPQMHVAVRVSPRMLGSDDENDQHLLWVRGLVVESLRDDRHGRVRLFDYGNEVIVSSEHIRPLDQQFASRLPSLAMLFYVDRHSVADFFKSNSKNLASVLVVADVVEFDNQVDIPVVKLLTISREKGGNGVSVQEY